MFYIPPTPFLSAHNTNLLNLYLYEVISIPPIFSEAFAGPFLFLQYFSMMKQPDYKGYSN